MQLSLFKPADILPDNLRKIVTKIRADIRKVKVNKEWSLSELKISHHNHLMNNNNVIHFPYIKRQLFSCSKVRKQHDNKHS